MNFRKENKIPNVTFIFIYHGTSNIMEMHIIEDTFAGVNGYTLQISATPLLLVPFHSAFFFLERKGTPVGRHESGSAKLPTK